MKKIIGGKRYDTETAVKIGTRWNARRGDLNYIEESLYRKKTGEFFIHGEGGPQTRYAETVGQNEWTGGEKLIPISYDKAREWAEEYLDAEEYEAAFGEVSESDERVIISTSVPADAVELLKRESSRSGKPQGDILAELIREKYKG